MAHGCGTCLPCLIERKKIWASRILLESMQHSENCFLTLTYNNSSLKTLSGKSCPQDETQVLPPSLQPADLRDFLKRLRTEIAPKRIRFYAVGEYGHETQRPHYHLALFGYPPCERGQTRKRNGRNHALGCCGPCDLVQRKWGMGDIDIGVLEPKSAAYVAGYLTKKFTRPPEFYLDRYPEFSRQSNGGRTRSGGIGHDALYEVASEILKYEREDEDVVNHLMLASKQMMLGRYLTQKLSEMVGRKDENRQKQVNKLQEKMLPLRKAARDDNENPSLKAKVIAAGEGKRASKIARYKIFDTHGKKL